MVLQLSQRVTSLVREQRLIVGGDLQPMVFDQHPSFVEASRQQSKVQHRDCRRRVALRLVLVVLLHRDQILAEQDLDVVPQTGHHEVEETLGLRRSRHLRFGVAELEHIHRIAVAHTHVVAAYGRIPTPSAFYPGSAGI
jgi:hypothetical protein